MNGKVGVFFLLEIQSVPFSLGVEDRVVGIMSQNPRGSDYTKMDSHL